MESGRRGSCFSEPDKAKEYSVYQAFIDRTKAKEREKGKGYHNEGNQLCGLGQGFGGIVVAGENKAFLDDHDQVVSGVLSTQQGRGDGAIGA